MLVQSPQRPRFKENDRHIYFIITAAAKCGQAAFLKKTSIVFKKINCGGKMRAGDLGETPKERLARVLEAFRS